MSSRDPHLETERLRLRPLTLDDLDVIHELWTLAEVRRYLWDGETISRARAATTLATCRENFERHGHGVWLVALAADPAPIGFAGFHYFYQPPELHLLYGYAREHWNKGIATEAARAMLRYGFEEAGMERVVANADAPNQASIRVMQKAGMSFWKRAEMLGKEVVYYELARARFHAGPECWQLLK